MVKLDLVTALMRINRLNCEEMSIIQDFTKIRIFIGILVEKEEVPGSWREIICER
jgi:hypothetical protein